MLMKPKPAKRSLRERPPAPIKNEKTHRAPPSKTPPSNVCLSTTQRPSVARSVARTIASGIAAYFSLINLPEAAGRRDITHDHNAHSRPR
jgi:hypothetical protein